MWKSDEKRRFLRLAGPSTKGRSGIVPCSHSLLFHHDISSRTCISGNVPERGPEKTYCRRIGRGERGQSPKNILAQKFVKSCSRKKRRQKNRNAPLDFFPWYFILYLEGIEVVQTLFIARKADPIARSEIITHVIEIMRRRRRPIRSTSAIGIKVPKKLIAEAASWAKWPTN